MELHTPLIDSMPNICDEEHHTMMNKSRIAQSLPPEYIKGILTRLAGDLKVEKIDGALHLTKKHES